MNDLCPKKENSKKNEFIKCAICGCRRKRSTRKGTYFRSRYVCEKCLAFIISTDFGDGNDDVAL